jgi:3D (Asp-Asp-Asp) domain-containing protein
MVGRLAVAVVVVLAAAGSVVALAAQSGPAHAAHRATRPRHPRPSPHRATAAHSPRRHSVYATSTPPPSQSRCQKAAPPVSEHAITHRRWLRGVTITEYYPAPERWFSGRRVHAPGLSGTYAVDWLYSAHGLAMEGSGVDRDGRPVHIAQLGSTGWVNARGRPTVPVCLGKWSNGFPVWLIGGWRNPRNGVTFPLGARSWSNGPGGRLHPYGGVTFARGESLPLHYYRSIAVDPRLIPLGSRVYVPAYRHDGHGGWFVAQDTGGAINGHHIDVYRPAPNNPDDFGRYLTRQRILVVPPG